MPLNKQTIPINLTAGLDDDTDPPWLPAGKLQISRNVSASRGGRLVKRNGFSALTTAARAGNTSNTKTITTSDKLSVYKDELLLRDGQYLFAYQPTASNWQTITSVQKNMVPTITQVDSGADHTCHDYLEAGGYGFSAWGENTDTRVNYIITDLSTGTRVTQVTTIVSAARPKIIETALYVCIFYSNTAGTTVSYARFTKSSITTAPTTVTMTTTNHTGGNYDVIQDRTGGGSGTDLVIYAYHNGTTLFAHCARWNIGTGVVDTAAVSTGTGAQNAIGFLAQWPAQWTFGTVSLSMGSTVAGIVNKRITVSTLAVLTTTALVAAETSANVRNICGHVIGDVANTYYQPFTLWELAASPTTNTQVKMQFQVGAAYILGRNVCLASRFALVSEYNVATSTNAEVYCLLSDDSTYQSGYYVYQMSNVLTYSTYAYLSAQILYGQGGGRSTVGSCLANLSISGTKLKAGLLQKTAVVGETPLAVFFSKGAVTCELETSAAKLGAPVSVADKLYLPGGIVKTYPPIVSSVSAVDVTALQEATPIKFPEAVTLTAGAAGSLTPSSVYWYVLIYQWTDQVTGRVCRSAPSVPVSVTLSAAQNSVTVTMPTYRTTVYNANIAVFAYRSEGLGGGALGAPSTYYADNSMTNDGTADTVAFVDSIADSTLVTREPLYTTGGVFDNYQAPPCFAMIGHRNRLWCISSEDGSIWPSFEIQPGMGVAFNQRTKIVIANNGDGMPVALATLDDKVVIFKASAIYVVSGDGPDQLGRGLFSQPERVSGVVGTSLVNSVVSTPVGVFFKDSKGIYLLTRSLETVYIGAPVESYNSLTVTAAVAMTTVPQVRFSTTEGTTLIYDYEQKIWTTDTNQAAASGAVLWKNQFTWCGADGVVKTQDAGYSDNGSFIVSTIQTGPISVGQIGGFQRIYQIDIVGDIVGASILNLSVKYDLDNGGSYTQTASLNPAASTQGTGTRFRISLPPARQKCSSVEITITDSAAAGNTAGAAILGVVLTVGVKAGTKPLPSTTKML